MTKKITDFFALEGNYPDLDAEGAVARLSQAIQCRTINYADHSLTDYSEFDKLHAHMKASSIPLSAFSNAAYDFSAVISRDTFVETCRQLAARKAGKPLEDITEIDLGFDLIYLPQPATPWLLDMLPYIIMTVGLMAFWLMMMRQQGGGGGKMMTFGHSPARVFEPDGNRITFADVAGAVEETWGSAKEQIKRVVNNVIFPVVDMILAILFFVKLGTAYFDYRKHGQFEFTAPCILFACLVFTLTAPLYIWKIIG